MRVLIDSNVFLYTAIEPKELSRRARLVLEDPETELFVSVVTPWELALSVVKRLLVLPVPLSQFYGEHMRRLGAHELQVTSAHGLVTERFPYASLKDPMDRILAGQAIVEGMPLVTSDSQVPMLGVDVIW
jgi:PIN domain nuclease of toxin-antitoxin system